MPDITIVNTSPLFYLHRLGLIEILEKLYGHITVPEAVNKELKPELVKEILELAGKE